MNDIVILTTEEMRTLLKPHKRPKGRFIAQIETGKWVGADTHYGACPRKKTGTFAEVIEWFIPYTGVRQCRTERFDGIRANADGIVRIPYEELKDTDTKRAARFRAKHNSEPDDLDLAEWED